MEIYGNLCVQNTDSHYALGFLPEFAKIWKSLPRDDADQKPGPIALNDYKIWNKRYQNW